jgi:hypothetical protein
MAPNDGSLFRKEQWPRIAIVFAVYLAFGGWFFFPPLLLGLGAVWPFRGRITTLFRAKQRWESELAVMFSAAIVGLLVFQYPYMWLLKNYVWDK